MDDKELREKIAKYFKKRDGYNGYQLSKAHYLYEADQIIKLVSAYMATKKLVELDKDQSLPQIPAVADR